MNSEGDITLLLQRIRSGKDQAREELWSLVYKRLRELAHGRLKQESKAELMETTALVHETYLKLSSVNLEDIQNRGHFYAVSARAMRRILVDKARKRHAAKRDSERAPQQAPESSWDLLALHNALEEMAAVSPRLVTVVECKFFGGLSYQQIAEAMGVSVKTIERDWQRAKAYLKMAMTQE